MKRFSVADGLYERINTAQKAIQFGGETYGPQLTEEQRARSIPWQQDTRFKTDPATGAVFFDEMFLTPEEVQKMQQEWPEEEKVENEVTELGKKLRLEKPAHDVQELVYPIAQRYFESIPQEKQVTKEETEAYVNNILSGMGASVELLTAASTYLDDIFSALHTLERSEHIRQRSIKALRQKKITASVLASYYGMIHRKGQTEEEWIPSASEQRTIKRLDRIWAIDELQRLKSGQTPEQYYGVGHGDFPVLTKEEAERILLNTREHEDFSVPIEDIPAYEQQGLGGEDKEPVDEEEEIKKELSRPRKNPILETEVLEAPVEKVEEEIEGEGEGEEEEDALYVTKKEQDEIEGEE